MTVRLKKRFVGLAAALTLVAGLFAVSPGTSQAAPLAPAPTETIAPEAGVSTVHWRHHHRHYRWHHHHHHRPWWARRHYHRHGWHHHHHGWHHHHRRHWGHHHHHHHRRHWH